MESVYLRLVILVTAFLVTIHSLNATILDFDRVWQQRQMMAIKAAKEAYNPNPHEVVHHLNHQVHLAYEARRNSTRRSLKGNKNREGPCEATNPIDRCWRCDKNWAENRKKLADCAMGFGRKTTGGKAGKYYIVTDNSDNDVVNPKNGTLRHAVIQKEPLWIYFAHNMNIQLKQELLVTSDKTIDGRGANIQFVNGGQITVQLVQNVIITNLHIHHPVVCSGGSIRDSVDHFGNRGQSDGDGISLYGATNVWIDHISLSNGADGLIDANTGSTGITISNCHMTNHNDVMLLGASESYDKDKIMQVTVAFNHFGKNLTQRMPRIRWGFAHVLNNDYTQWQMFAIGGSSQPTILSQGNRFVAPFDQNAKEVTKRDLAPESVWKNWNWRSEGDLLLNGAFFIQSGKPIGSIPDGGGIPAKPGQFAAELTRHAGTLQCFAGRPC